MKGENCIWKKREATALPTPRYIIFYNGTEREEEQVDLRLSASFEKQDGNTPCLECIATVLNINYGQNRDLMQNCRKLYEYSFFVNGVRNSLARGRTLASAIDEAIELCLDRGILSEFLLKQQAEVKMMILSHYDEELHFKTLYEEGHMDGVQEGKTRVNELNRILIKEKRLDDLERSVNDREFQEALFKELKL